MNPEAMLDRVTTALRRLIDTAEPWEGLFPSMLDLEGRAMLREQPPAIPGQRDGDRAFLGGNLMHDHVVLRLMYDLDAAGLANGCAAAADRYLERFATHCTETVSGLFPWGEHSFWQLVDDRVGSGHRPEEPDHAIHDHLRQAPLWLWERLWRINPACVERFAEGLDNHWTQGEPREYIRHAFIGRRERHPRGARSCDFPRHGGFYILDWAFAWTHTGRDDFRGQIDLMLDYWWDRRFDDGALLVESRSSDDATAFTGIVAPSQSQSLAASLLDTAGHIGDNDSTLAATMRERAQVYLDGFLAAPHRPEEHLYVSTFDLATREAHRPMAAWGSVYGSSAAGGPALLCVAASRHTGDRRLLSWAESVGAWYLAEPFPSDVVVPACDAGLALELFAALHEETGERRWLDQGLERAAELADIYLDRPLPRGAAGIGWYESQMGPGYLLHGLARMGLLVMGAEPCPVAADFTSR